MGRTLRTAVTTCGSITSLENRLQSARMTSRVRHALCFFVVANFTGACALAAGGAHVIDDAQVVDEGHCELEAWIAHFDPSDSFLSASSTCGARALPNIEWAIAAARLSKQQTTLSTAFKWHWGGSGAASIGFAGSASVTSGKDGVELGVILPVTWEVTRGLRVNVNAGAIHATEGPSSLDAYLGGQAEISLKHGLELMVEAFDRSRVKPGAQIGLRWRTDEAHSTYDFLIGHQTDGESSWSMTLGWTLAF